MATDFKSLIAQVKTSYDIEDYIASDGVALKSSSAGKSKGLCPLHSEKTPSFTVDSRYQNFMCWGCKESGDIIAYVMKREHFEFMEAVKKLANEKGIEVEETEASGPTIDYKSLKAVLKDSALYFVREFRKLDESHAAKREITERGLDLKVMNFGYAPEGKTSLVKFLREKGYTDELIVQAGVAHDGKHGLFDFWSGRLMFVITDIQGNPIAFSGRKLFDSDKMGKYVNSPETPVFNKSAALFGLTTARKALAKDYDDLFVVEGQFDTCAFIGSELPNVVAGSGTAFTSEQARLCLRLLRSERGSIVFCFDPDEAGLKAAFSTFTKIPELHERSVAVIMPDGMDPCDYLKTHGPEALREYVSENQVSVVDFILNYVEQGLDLSRDVDRARFLKQAAKAFSGMKSRTVLDSAIRALSLKSGVSFETGKSEVAEARKSLREPTEKAKDSAEESRPEFDYEKSDLELSERIIESGIPRTAAKVISLASTEETLLKGLEKYRKLIPDEMQTLVDDLLLSPERVITENFTLPKTAEIVFSPDFSVSSSDMTCEERREHFKFLMRRLQKSHRKAREEQRRWVAMSALSGGADATIDDLRKALEAEKGK